MPAANRLTKINASSFSKKQLLLFALAFGLIGGYILLRTFASPNPNLPGDLNADNTVNISDLSILLTNYGTTNTNADINLDGTVNILDMSILLSHYGQSYNPPPPPPSNASFDGRATLMSQLFSTSTNNQGQSPAIWDCLCFLNNDIKLAADSNYGQVYDITVGDLSSNPWWPISQHLNSRSAEVTKIRQANLGGWDWYAQVVRFEPGFTGTDWGVVDQLNYPTLTSPPVAIAVDKAGVGIDRHGGLLVLTNGYWLAPSQDFPRFFSVSSVVGKWVEWVVGVKWALDTSGEVDVYTRCKACGETNFTLRYQKTGIPTYQQRTGDPIKTSSTDKQGLYYGYSTAPSSWTITNRVSQRGLMVFPDKASAMATFP